PRLWRPLPASLAGGAGARPDHPITRHREDRNPAAQQSPATSRRRHSFHQASLGAGGDRCMPPQQAIGDTFPVRYPVRPPCSDSSVILLTFAVRSGEPKEEAGVKHLRNVAMLALLAAGILLGANTATRAGDAAIALKGYDPVAYFTDERPM